MNTALLVRFREAVSRHKDQLVEWLDKDNHPGERDICLGNANLKQCEQVISCHDEALECIESGEFGKCKICHEDVEPERLELDFTTNVCLGHYSDERLRTLERDLELAAKVQQHLLPSTVPALPGIQISAHAEPAHIVGGDYFDFFTTQTGQQGFAIADVMGKGLPASMLMSNLQASLRILGPEYPDLDNMAVRLNELFRYNLKLIRFISLFLGSIDYQAKQLTFCNAGHHPPLFWNSATRAIQWLMPTGPAIGLAHSPTFGTDTLGYQSGDLLLLYTDGLTEARNRDNEEFGEERLAELTLKHLELSADRFIRTLQQAVSTFAGQKLQDDLTLMVIKFD